MGSSPETCPRIHVQPLLPCRTWLPWGYGQEPWLSFGNCITAGAATGEPVSGYILLSLFPSRYETSWERLGELL